MALFEQTSAFVRLPGTAILQGIVDEDSRGWLKLGAPAIQTKKTNASHAKGAAPQARAPTRGRLSKLGLPEKAGANGMLP